MKKIVIIAFLCFFTGQIKAQSDTIKITVELSDTTVINNLLCIARSIISEDDTTTYTNEQVLVNYFEYAILSRVNSYRKNQAYKKVQCELFDKKKLKFTTK
jgi:hypothetical protein